MREVNPWLFIFVLTITSFSSRAEDITGDPLSVFNLEYRVKIGKRIFNGGNDRNMTGDGFTYQGWMLDSPGPEIVKGASGEIIQDRVVWFTAGQDDVRFARAITIFKSKADFAPILKTLQQALGDPGLRHAYEHYCQDPDKGRDIGIWMCSPKYQTLLFLDYKD
jgi:hypothetical protein